MADSTVTENALNGKDGGIATVPKRAKATTSRPTTLNKVVEAIRSCDDNPRKGTSVKAIKTWIDANYKDTKSTQRGLLKKALENGLGRQVIERPKKEDEGKPLLTGYYRLAKPKPAPKGARKATAKTKPLKKAGTQSTDGERRSRSTSPKGKKARPVPRARARSVSATPRVSKSKKVRSRLSKSHSPLRTPKLIKPKSKAMAGGKKKTTSPALIKPAAKTKKSPVGKKQVKKSPAAEAAAKNTTKTAKPAKATGKATVKDGGKKKK
ncbi:histone H1.0-like [Acanthaster planci]|uniref:Histone H1.0-like n=1 Tax=Acanthaster planci TaxID=133434 RepID=A0A8B7Z6I1_ACAPL|nr:histone H1.0-like [Acanthaster planci]